MIEKIAFVELPTASRKSRANMPKTRVPYINSTITLVKHLVAMEHRSVSNRGIFAMYTRNYSAVSMLSFNCCPERKTNN